MIDKKDFLVEMKKLEIAFNNFDLTKERLSLFYEMLQDYELNEFIYAVNETIKNDRFAPTIADIRSKIENLRPAPKDKAREFEAKIFKLDTDTTIKHFEKLGDQIAVQVLNSNYKTLRECTLDKINTTKAQMREQYLSLLINQQKQTKIHDNNLNIGIKELTNDFLITGGSNE